MEQTKVLIGIQARSTSKRFPGKVFADLGGKPILQHVIDAAKNASAWINKAKDKSGVECLFGLVIPHKDEIGRRFKNEVSIIVEGPENDVLERYRILVEKFQPNYLVRITADCPLLPSHIITKHIKIATLNAYDYVSNVDERLRTELDGFDVEVISRRLFDYVAQTAKDPRDREHVTTFIRRCTPNWASVGHVISYLAMADMKLSVDTHEDLERVKFHYERINSAIKNARAISGEWSVYRV